MKIFDCFCFFNELELLELRLMELADLVDYFVLVESDKTHTGQDKEFIFEKNKKRFQKYHDKIIHIKVQDSPEYDPQDILKLEQFQRNAIVRGLEKVAMPGDKILISDLDEIPNPDVIKKYLSSETPLYFQHDLFYYYVNNQVQKSCGGTVMANYAIFGSPQKQRAFGKRRYNLDPAKHSDVIPHSGWHYSYLAGGDQERIVTKINSFSESSNLLHLAGTKEEILEKMHQQKDLFGRTSDRFGRPLLRLQQKIVDIKDNQPKSLSKFLKKYPQFFFKPACKLSIIIAFYNSHLAVARQVRHFAAMNLPDDIEFIFVDDGSNPAHNLADYQLKNLQILYTNDKRPWTQGLARNLGSKAARGEYLLMTDIDHILSKEAIMDSYHFDGDKMIFPRYFGVLLPDGTLSQEPKVLEEYGLDIARLKTKRGLYASVHGNTFTMKRSTFEKLGRYNEANCLFGHHAGSRQGEDSVLNRRWNHHAAANGLTLALGSKIYMFPIARYHINGDKNPMGLFHDLSQELVPQPLKV